MKRLMGIALVVGFLATFGAARAEFDYGYGSYGAGYGSNAYGYTSPSYSSGYGSSGYGDAWSGLYGTGGYNLYGWGSDIYNLGNYMGGYGDSWYGSNWGGSCSSLMNPCSGGYDYANLGYGSSYGSYGYDATNIHININVPIYIGGGFSSCNTGCGSCGGYNQGCNQCGGYSMGCGGGYGGYPSYPSFPSFPSYPQFPTNPNSPTVVVDVTTPPVILPPWGSCGSPMIPCPGGPVQQPTPNYSFRDDTGTGTPVRYRVPRTAHSVGGF